MSLGEHLGTHQNVHAFPANIVLHGVPCMLAPGAVAVDAQNARAGKTLPQQLFEALGTLPQAFQILVATGWAGVRQSFLMPTVVTAQGCIAKMPDQARAAAAASGAPATGAANQDWGEAPPIQEHQALLAASPAFIHGL